MNNDYNSDDEKKDDEERDQIMQQLRRQRQRQRQAPVIPIARAQARQRLINVIAGELTLIAHNMRATYNLTAHQTNTITFIIPTFATYIADHTNTAYTYFSNKILILNRTPVERRYNLWHATNEFFEAVLEYVLQLHI